MIKYILNKYERPGFTTKHIKGEGVDGWKDFYMNYDEFFNHIKELNPDKNLQNYLKLYYCGYAKGMLTSITFYENKYGI